MIGCRHRSLRHLHGQPAQSTRGRALARHELETSWLTIFDERGRVCEASHKPRSPEIVGHRRSQISLNQSGAGTNEGALATRTGSSKSKRRPLIALPATSCNTSSLRSLVREYLPLRKGSGDEQEGIYPFCMGRDASSYASICS